MSDSVSRDELKVHLDLLEEKSQRRADGVEAKIDRLSDTVSRLVDTVVEVRAETRADNKVTRSTVVGTAIASTLAVVAIVVTVVIGAVQIVNSTQGTMTTALGNAIGAFSARPREEPAQPEPKEGDKAANPQTGEKVVFKDGKWTIVP